MCIRDSTTNAQGKRWYKALQKMEFNVVQDVFMTPTAMGLCDLFLPVTTFAEHDLSLIHIGRPLRTCRCAPRSS